MLELPFISEKESYKECRRGELYGQVDRFQTDTEHTVNVSRLSSEAVRGNTFHMESNQADSVQYNRWNEDNINMNVGASQSAVRRIYNRLCIGNTGIAVKTAGALAALVCIYMIGYVTGYYVHRCG
ncbi:hypothetical protein Q5P01_007374 [Channa striata]|uniref:Small integral membrane protein 1 n=1 Tax=Channa striata TaxID=64152 RepID=A0AA88T1H9_CHASR|nr:hypothetical protein Q5P01_007374 [Channa striata]